MQGGEKEMFKRICGAAAIAGGINWILKGLFSFDAAAWLCGGAGTTAARAAYLVIGAAACLAIFCGGAAQKKPGRENHPGGEDA
jgi:uncharacterized membrane protein YuzA (DUF378 family)